MSSHHVKKIRPGKYYVARDDPPAAPDCPTSATACPLPTNVLTLAKRLYQLANHETRLKIKHAQIAGWKLSARTLLWSFSTTFRRIRGIASMRS